MPRKIFRNPTRRRFVAGAASAGLALLAAPALIRNAGAQAGGAGNPFSLGVASGAPRPDGFVLWTRLAPEPLSVNPETPGGMTDGDVTLRFEIAADDGMKNIVRSGMATAEQKFAYSVHLDIAGLEPGRSYWYRFFSGDAASPVGRAMTLPAPGAAPGALRFGLRICRRGPPDGAPAFRRHRSGDTADLP
jgi:alkaline phosphatase D